MSESSDKKNEQASKPEEMAGIIFHGKTHIESSQVAGGNISGMMNVGTSPADLARMFAPLYASVQQAPPQVQEEAQKKVDAIKQEVAKGKDANDNLVARLLEGLVSLVPGAVSAIGGLLGQPILAGLAGPITQSVLKKITGHGET